MARLRLGYRRFQVQVSIKAQYGSAWFYVIMAAGMNLYTKISIKLGTERSRRFLEKFDTEYVTA